MTETSFDDFSLGSFRYKSSNIFVGFNLDSRIKDKTAK